MPSAAREDSFRGVVSNLIFQKWILVLIMRNYLNEGISNGTTSVAKETMHGASKVVHDHSRFSFVDFRPETTVITLFLENSKPE